MKKLKLLLIGSIFALPLSQVNAQKISSSTGKSKKESFIKDKKLKDRLVYGSALIFNFDNSYLRLGISPKVGYKITPNFYAGLGVKFEYLYYKNGYLANNHYGAGTKVFPRKHTIYNGNVWMQYHLLKLITLHAEAELNNFNDYYKPEGGRQYDEDGWYKLEQKRVTLPSVLLGGGIYQPLSRKIGIYGMVLYDALYEHNRKNGYSVYSSPLIYRVGFNMAL